MEPNNIKKERRRCFHGKNTGFCMFGHAYFICFAKHAICHGPCRRQI